MKCTNLLAESTRRSIVLALMVCCVLSPASLYGLNGRSGNWTCLEVEGALHVFGLFIVELLFVSMSHESNDKLPTLE